MVAGLIGLVVGGDLLVRGAVALAKRLGVSPLVIGLTLVGFGTSTPELVTSLQAAWAGSPGIAVGNVVGSNSANILLILGLSALIAPVAVTRSMLGRDGTALALATVMCLVVVQADLLMRGTGAVFLAALALYLVVTLRAGRIEGDAGAEDGAMLLSLGRGRALLYLMGGLALTIGAARLLVTGAISVAAQLGMSEAAIGVSIVAVGTSMPELVTSVIAARRGQADVAIGNVVGSNLFNILGILGVTALVQPLAVPAEIARFDIWVMVAATVLLLVMGYTGARVTRSEGMVLLGSYAAYVAVLLAWLA